MPERALRLFMGGPWNNRVENVPVDRRQLTVPVLVPVPVPVSLADIENTVYSIVEYRLERWCGRSISIEIFVWDGLTIERATDLLWEVIL